MDSRFIDKGPVDTISHYNEADDQLVIERVQDVEPILEGNKIAYNAGDGYTPSRDLQHVARIPNVIIEKWMKEGINVFDKNDWPKIVQKLNDPEYRYLRTSGGKI